MARWSERERERVDFLLAHFHERKFTLKREHLKCFVCSRKEMDVQIIVVKGLLCAAEGKKV